MAMYPVKPQADPKRPYKMYAAIVAAIVGSLLTNEVINTNPWFVAIGGSVLAGIACYITPNPIVNKKVEYK